MARAAVVLAVGDRPRGQASSGTPTSRITSEETARADRGLPVMAMSRSPQRLIRGSIFSTSSDSPLLDTASTTSSRMIMPRSPWLASAA